ncbi:hypothetical protein Bca101_057695 [Brassica carinata]
MRTGLNPYPSSSSIGARVRSKKNRAATDPLESTDSSDFSLDLTAAVDNPGQAVVERASPTAEIERLPFVGPLSTIGVEEVESWIEVQSFRRGRHPDSLLQRSSPFPGGQDIGGVWNFPGAAESSLVEDVDRYVEPW